MLDELTRHKQLNPDRHESSRILDTAVGILVGWRRCSTRAAFRELLSVSDRNEVPVLAVASALLSLASNDADTHGSSTAAQIAAEREWGRNHLM
jgi:AmiR/NasT family two-component response regulator